jgi:hypothetical protein
MPPSLPTTTISETANIARGNNIEEDHNNDTSATIAPAVVVVVVEREVRNDQNQNCHHIKPALWPLILERS